MSGVGMVAGSMLSKAHPHEAHPHASYQAHSARPRQS
jgi:hypothetical protein